MNADDKAKKQISAEIREAVGDIGPHWYSEKSRMFNHLQIEFGHNLDFVRDRIAYLTEFGDHINITNLEMPIIDTFNRIVFTDGFQRIGVIGIKPKSKLFVMSQGIRVSIFQLVYIMQEPSVITEPGIIDQAVFYMFG